MSMKNTGEIFSHKVLVPMSPHGEFNFPHWYKKLTLDISSRNLNQLGIGIERTEEEISSELLEDTDVLYILIPRFPYSEREQKIIIEFIQKGGSLYLVSDEEMRSPLSTNVNKLIEPFDMELTHDVDKQFWGHDIWNGGAIAKKGVINKEDREIPFHGGRAVIGGTPFSYIMDEEGVTELVHGAYKEVEGGGRIIVLGEVMASIQFLGTDTGVRLSGERMGLEEGKKPDPSRVYMSPLLTDWWGKDSEIFVVETMQWLVANKNKKDL